MKLQKFYQILAGAGRLFDFSGSYNAKLRRKHVKTDPGKLDRNALSSDWQKVGDALRTSMGKLEDQMPQHKTSKKRTSK